MPLWREDYGLQPMHASHPLDEAIRRGPGRPWPKRPNSAIERYCAARAPDSILPPLRAALRSPLRPGESNCADKPDEKMSSICT